MSENTAVAVVAKDDSSFGQLLRQLESEIKAAKETIQKFADQLKTGEARRALRWAGDSFEAAATIEETTKYLAYLRDGDEGGNVKALATISAEIGKRVMQHARGGVMNSTNMLSNIYEEAEGKVLAKLYETLVSAKRWIEFDEFVKSLPAPSWTRVSKDLYYWQVQELDGFYSVSKRSARAKYYDVEFRPIDGEVISFAKPESAQSAMDRCVSDRNKRLFEKHNPR